MCSYSIHSVLSVSYCLLNGRNCSGVGGAVAASLACFHKSFSYAFLQHRTRLWKDIPAHLDQHQKQLGSQGLLLCPLQYYNTAKDFAVGVFYLYAIIMLNKAIIKGVS